MAGHAERENAVRRAWISQRVSWHRRIGTALPCLFGWRQRPGYSAFGLDALFPCLTDLEWLCNHRWRHVVVSRYLNARCWLVISGVPKSLSVGTCIALLEELTRSTEMSTVLDWSVSFGRKMAREADGS